MKTNRTILMVLLSTMVVQLALAGNKIIVMGHNVENFFYSTDRTRTTDGNLSRIPYYNDEEGRQQKMDAITNAYFPADGSVQAADIYCFNEVECCDEIMEYIVSNFKAKSGINYQYVADGLSYEKENEPGGLIKSGYIYNADKIKPYGANTATGSGYIYTRQMRMQTFEEIASGERFTIALNHFKAGSVEENGETRKWNAECLLAALPNANDPDILIMGDLNSEMGEECLTMIQNAGYVEQLLKYEPTAWSYVYNYNEELIDHAFANSTMEAQVTNAKMLHIANYTSLGWNYFSDHDAYMLEVELQHTETPTYSFVKTTTVKDGGQYLLAAPLNGGLDIAEPVPASKDYSYLTTQTVTEEDGVITLDKMTNAFTFEAAGDGNYYIKDSNNRYIYQTAKANGDYYNSVAATAEKEKAHQFTVTLQSDGTFKLLSQTGYYIYATMYNQKTPEFAMTNYTTLYSGNYLPWLYEYRTPSSINTIGIYTEPTTTRKVMENGRMIIVTPNGKHYTLQGVQQQ